MEREELVKLLKIFGLIKLVLHKKEILIPCGDEVEIF